MTISKRYDYETGSLSQWTAHDGIMEKVPGRASVITSAPTPRQGSYAGKFTVLSGDNNVYNSGSGERCEVLDSSIIYGEGDDYWWGMSFYFPVGFFSQNSSWNTVTQWHGTASSGEGTTGFQIRNSTELWFEVYGGLNPTFTPVLSQKILDVITGQWIDIALRQKFSSNSGTGQVELWVNGVRRIAPTTLPTLFVGSGCYQKQGYYRTATNFSANVYHDGLRRGASYADVIAEFPGWGGGGGGFISASSNIADGATISASPTWTITTNPSEQKVRYFVNNVQVSEVTGPTTTFNYTLDTTLMPNGANTIGYWVFDSTPAVVFQSPTINVTVNNTQPGLVTTSSITEDQTLSGTVAWVITTNTSQHHVDYYVDDVKLNTQTGPGTSFTYNMDTNLFDDGRAHLAQYVVANSSNVTQYASPFITIHVRNHPRPPRFIDNTKRSGHRDVVSGRIIGIGGGGG